MYKNQLQELAQRSCFNLPCYACIREGPDHAPRFKASVNFNGEIFESPTYCNTLRQAEHAAAQVALNDLSTRGPSRSLTARVLDETGVYKNLLQETAHRAGLKLPVYITVRSGPCHVPVFTCNVGLAGVNFTGDPAKTKKQAEKNAAIAAWSSLKTMPNLVPLSQTSSKITGINGEEQDQINMIKVLSNFGPKDDIISVRRRDQNQAARRMLGCHSHRDTAGSSSYLQHQQRRLMDLLMDSASEGLTPKNSCFASLLPPPPPRKYSKILPQTSSSLYPSTDRPNQEPVMSKSRVQMKEVSPPPLYEHQRDEDDWLNGKSELIKLPVEKEGPSKSTSSLFYGENLIMDRPFSLSNTGKLNSLIQPDHTTPSKQTHMGNRLLGPPTAQSQMAISSSTKAPTCSHYMGRRKIHNGGYYPQRMAPAVQIRSVIPVCAAAPPPSTRPVQPSNPPSMKEAAEVSTTVSPKFNKLQLYSNEIISKFNKLQV